MAFKLLKHNIIFIHIPKTGGTSIYNAFKFANSLSIISPDYAHRSIFELENNYKINADLYIAQCRHPFNRFLSHYQFLIDRNAKITEGLISDIKPTKYYSRMNEFLKMKNFNGFVEMLNDKNEINNFINDFPTEIAIFQKQVKFIETKKKVLVFKLENALIWNLFSKLGYNLIPLHERKSPKLNINVNNKMIDLVYNYFFDDYKFFGYEKNF